MGKIVATYHVKVTLREPDGLPDEGSEVEAPPTVAEIEGRVMAGIAEKLGELTVNATAERTDI